MTTTALRALEPTPDRPMRQLTAPERHIRASVDVEAAHLANPVVALARLLTSEAGAFARVSGDEKKIEIAVALEDLEDATVATAQSWVGWAVYNAGIRGQLRFDPAANSA